MVCRVLTPTLCLAEWLLTVPRVMTTPNKGSKALKVSGQDRGGCGWAAWSTLLSCHPALCYHR